MIELRHNHGERSNQWHLQSCHIVQQRIQEMNAAIPEVLRERGNELMLGGLYDIAEAELVEE